MEAVTTVFRNFETGLREASIDTKVRDAMVLFNPSYPTQDLLAAMKMLGLNPMEQEIVDVTNEIARNGLIFFPEFCEVVLARFRAEDEETFQQNMFKMLCGTDPHPELFRAKKYKIQEHFLTKQDFVHMMRNLPEKVSEEDIEEMFSYADKDQDGKISYSEFQVMMNPPQPQPPPRPDLKDLESKACKTELRVDGKIRPVIAETLVDNGRHSEVKQEEEEVVKMSGSDWDPDGPLPLSLENIKLHNKITKNISLKK